MVKKIMRRNKRNSNRSKGSKILLFIAIALFSVGVVTYLAISLYYNNHFYKNTMINGIDVSNLTVIQAEQAINAKVNSYILTLKGRKDMSEQIKGEDIDLHTVFDRRLTELLDEQNDFAWPVSLFKTHGLEINTTLAYEESMLKKQFDALACFEEANIVEPANAYISAYGVNGYEIIPEDLGAKVEVDILYKAVKKAIITLEPSLSLEKVACYQEPKVNAQYPALLKAMKEMNQIVSANITYQFGEVTEIVDGNRINQWISVNDEYQVTLDLKKIKEFVDYIGKNYNSFGRVRTFTTTYGAVLQIKGGDYGWWLNRSKEAEELTELVLSGQKLVRQPVYLQTARQYGADDVGNTYVEINLTAQHLFLYKDGILILESDFVSGNLSKSYGTPTGTYPIQYKENDAVLIGEDYESPVKYWMPFNGNIGLHDASWRKSFGKDIYLKNGSHGCINMPKAAAKTMFENVARGVPVIVYELPGTENYEIKKEKSKENIKETEETIETVPEN